MLALLLGAANGLELAGFSSANGFAAAFVLLAALSPLPDDTAAKGLETLGMGPPPLANGLSAVPAFGLSGDEGAEGDAAVMAANGLLGAAEVAALVNAANGLGAAGAPAATAPPLPNTLTVVALSRPDSSTVCFFLRWAVVVPASEALPVDGAGASAAGTLPGHGRQRMLRPRTHPTPAAALHRTRTEQVANVGGRGGAHDSRERVATSCIQRSLAQRHIRCRGSLELDACKDAATAAATRGGAGRRLLSSTAHACRLHTRRARCASTRCELDPLLQAP